MIIRFKNPGANFGIKVQSVIQGTIYLSLAQASFVLSGYALHIGLGRLLGPAEYGIYSIIISIATMLNLILSIGLSQAVSKYVSENENDSLSILKSSLCISIIIGCIASFIIVIQARNISILLNDDSFAPYIQLLALRS